MYFHIAYTCSIALRVEWAKAKARAERWTEEVKLVYEEMHRTIAYCNFKSEWWKDRATLRRHISPELADGLAAYAAEHADLEERLAVDLDRRWSVIRRRAKGLIDSEFAVGDEDEDHGTEDAVHAGMLPAETVTLNLRELETLDGSDDED